MSANKNQEQDQLSEYIKCLKDQHIKALLLKLKNEIRKDEVTWEQIKPLLGNIREKDEKVFNEVMSVILDS